MDEAYHVVAHRRAVDPINKTTCLKSCILRLDKERGLLVSKGFICKAILRRIDSDLLQPSQQLVSQMSKLLLSKILSYCHWIHTG